MVLVYLVGLLLLIIVDAWSRQSSDLSFLPFIFCLGPIIGVLPATLIGMLTGWSIGAVVEHNAARLAAWSAVLVGLVVAGMFAVFINILIWPWGWTCVLFRVGDCATYWSFLGIPSLIYIALGGGVSGWLRKQRTKI